MKLLSPSILASVLIVGIAFAGGVNNPGGGGGGPGTPTGPAGGDLGGTYPNPTVVSGADITNGSIANSGLNSATISVNSINCTLGGSCTISTSASSLTVGTTTIANGTSGNILYQNGASPTGTVGELALGATISNLSSTLNTVAPSTTTAVSCATHINNTGCTGNTAGDMGSAVVLGGTGATLTLSAASATGTGMWQSGQSFCFVSVATGNWTLTNSSTLTIQGKNTAGTIVPGEQGCLVADKNGTNLNYFPGQQVPSTTNLGGVLALASATSHQWVQYIDNTGVMHLSQPAFTDISGSITAAQCLNATTAAIGCVKGDASTLTITSGTISCTTATISQIGCVEGDNSTLTLAAGVISCTTATSVQIGCIKGDGSTLTITSGTISCTTATTSQIGCVKPDGTTITISGGTISAAAGGGGVTPSYFASNWYATIPVAQLTNSASGLTASTIYAYPFYLVTKLTINNVGVRATTAGSSNIQMAIYANNNATNRPTGAALCSTTSQANTGVAAPITGACATSSLSPGIYWFEVNQNDSTAKYTSAPLTSSNMSWLIGSATVGNVLAATSDSLNALTLAQAFGTWPTETSSSFTELSNNQPPLGIFEVSSVP